MQFDLPKEKTSIIKVIGVGGGGSNAVNYMFQQGIQGVNFVVCNTDAQALELSPVPNKIQLGPDLTEGRGAGSKPDIGREAMEESLPDIEKVLEVNTKMVFITAGMGGGTGTGGAPVLAKKCREMGILTVGIVTLPFAIEGKMRKGHASKGIEELRNNVDTLIVISNDKLKTIFGKMKVSEAFSRADDILATAAKGIAEIITVPGYINVDFEDVRTVMMDSGVAIMGSASAEGEHRALKAVEEALSSPLLNDNDISGAAHILLNITSGTEEVEMDELTEIFDYVQEQAGEGTDLIWGNCTDESLGDKLSVTIIATGFESNQSEKREARKNQTKIVYDLNNDITDGGKSGEAASTPTKSQEEDEMTPFIKEEENTPSAQQEDEAPDIDEDRWQQTFVFNQEEDDEVENEPKTVRRYSLEDDHLEDEGEEVHADSVSDDNSAMQQSNRHQSNEHSGHTAQTPSQMASRKAVLSSFNSLKRKKDLQQLEAEPAYMRRKVQLDDTPHSSDNNLSRLSLNEREEDDGETKRYELRDNNSFLHDSVD